MNRTAPLLCILLSLTSCGTIKRTVSAIPMPSLSGMSKILPSSESMKKLVPSMKGIKKMLPDLSGDDSTGAEDPFQHYTPQRDLGYGDTLRISVYEGVREPEEVYKGLLMVDKKGIVDFEEIGSARFGGRSAEEARSLTESVLRGAGWTSGQLHVHLISIENVPLVCIRGNVGRPGVYQFSEGMRARDVIAAAGGRAAQSTSRAVYITHKGQRRFYTTEASASGFELEAGDIVEVSEHL
jgi:protein involved in polysaccharide export with SLBB domain